MQRRAEWSRREFCGAAALVGAAAFGLPAALRGADSTPLFGVSRGLDEAAALKDAGYDYLEGQVTPVLMPARPDADFDVALARLKALPLSVPVCNVFIPSAMKLVGPETAHDAAAAYAEVALKRAGQAGVTIIVFGSGGARKIPDGFDVARAREQFIVFASRIAPIAERAGVRLVLEPLNRKETNFINSVSEGASIVDAVSHPAFRLHADVYHMMQENESPDAIRAAGGRIIHTHVAQAVTRLAPLPGGSDFRPYFRALKDIGYRGRMSIEGNWPEGENAYAKSLAHLREQWVSA